MQGRATQNGKGASGFTGPRLAYTVDDAAKMLSISRRMLYQLIGDGQLRSFKVGSRRLVSHRELERLIAERSAEA